MTMKTTLILSTRQNFQESKALLNDIRRQHEGKGVLECWQHGSDYSLTLTIGNVRIQLQSKSTETEPMIRLHG